MRKIPGKVKILDDVAAEITCIECDGTGIWTYLPPENKPTRYVTCKGTEKMLISI